MLRLLGLLDGMDRQWRRATVSRTAQLGLVATIAPLTIRIDNSESYPIRTFLIIWLIYISPGNLCFIQYNFVSFVASSFLVCCYSHGPWDAETCTPRS